LLLSLAATSCGAGGERLDAAADAQSPTPAASEPSTANVPEEFRAACGKPGAEVFTEQLRVVVKHSECDLTGVTIFHKGRSAAVPEPGIGVGSSSGVSVEVDEETGDVTFTAEAETAQY